MVLVWNGEGELEIYYELTVRTIYQGRQLGSTAYVSLSQRRHGPQPKDANKN